MATVGIIKSDEDLYLDYLAKVGDYFATRIRSDLRPWPDGNGGEVNRQCASWEECHKLLLEFDDVPQLGGAVNSADPMSDRHRPKRRRGMDRLTEPTPA